MIIHKSLEIDTMLNTTIDFYSMHEWFLLNKIEYQYAWRTGLHQMSSLEEALNEAMVRFVLSEENYNLYPWIKLPEEEITVSYHHYYNDDIIYFINATSDKVINSLNRFLNLKAFL